MIGHLLPGSLLLVVIGAVVLPRPIQDYATPIPKNSPQPLPVTSSELPKQIPPPPPHSSTSQYPPTPAIMQLRLLWEIAKQKNNGNLKTATAATQSYRTDLLPNMV